MTQGSPRLRVLFAEDAFDHALIVKAFLSSADRFETVHSQDGDAAAALLRDETWDLFVTDLNLPGKDGFELIRICRELHPDVPVLATTGYTANHYHEAAFRAGAKDLMTKPLEKEEFLMRVARLVDDPERDKAEDDEDEEDPPVVLAVGGLVGDAEMGCGGSLSGWSCWCRFASTRQTPPAPGSKGRGMRRPSSASPRSSTRRPCPRRTCGWTSSRSWSSSTIRS